MSTLLSHVEIANLVYRYAELVDAGDYDGIGALFAQGGISAAGSDAVDEGHDAVVDRDATLSFGVLEAAETVPIR